MLWKVVKLPVYFKIKTPIICYFYKSYQVINLSDWSVTVEEKKRRLCCLWSLEVTLLLHKSRFARFLWDLTRFIGKLPMNAAMTSTILRYFKHFRVMQLFHSCWISAHGFRRGYENWCQFHTLQNRMNIARPAPAVVRSGQMWSEIAVMLKIGWKGCKMGCNLHQAALFCVRT